MLQRSARRSRMPYFTTTTIGFLYPGLTGGKYCKRHCVMTLSVIAVKALPERVKKVGQKHPQMFLTHK